MRSRSAFTLTEILIVIALIVLVLALAVPAFNFISGSRSVDAGENLVSAMLGRARADAMENRRTTGVFFFREDATDRTCMVMVGINASQSEDAVAEPRVGNQYKGWAMTQDDGVTPTKYRKGDVVYHLLQSPTAGRPTVQRFTAKQDHTSSVGSTPPGNPWQADSTQSSSGIVGEVIDAIGEVQYLPAGVGAQLVNNPAYGPDRYVRNGVILFNANGAVAHEAYQIPSVDGDGDTFPDNLLAKLMGRAIGANIPANNATVFSQLGVVLYDLASFRAAHGADAEKDFVNDQGYAYNANNAAGTPVEGEEDWLDNNSLQLLLNRTNGTLIRGE